MKIMDIPFFVLSLLIQANSTTVYNEGGVGAAFHFLIESHSTPIFVAELLALAITVNT